MSQRIWCRLIAAVAIGGIPGASTAQEPAGTPEIDLPFSRAPGFGQGPPRAMGVPPFGQSLPPSDLAIPRSGPPRSMGESPLGRPSEPDGAYSPIFPSLAPGGPLLPGLAPSGAGIAPGGAFGAQPDALLSLPGLLGEPSGAPEVGPRPGDGLPFALPDPPELQLGTPEVPRGAPRIDDLPAGPPLGLDDVRHSAERRYPPFLAVLDQRGVADGQVTSSLGSFDLIINADSRNYPLGFYERSLQDLFFEQPLRDLGGKVFAGYRIAQGHWPTYYNYLNTRGGGAFVAGVELPLLRDRAIDAKRAKLYQSEIERRKVEPTILKDRITLLKEASKAYWDWVAAGQSYAIYQDLLELTDSQFRALIAQSRPEIARVAQIDVVAFQSVRLKRQQQVVEARRNFQQAGILLSFYLRDVRGMPAMPDPRSLPDAFPQVDPPEPSRADADVALALRLRPEVFGLLLEYDKAKIDRELAENLLLPSMDLYVYNEQNVGVRDADLRGDFRPNILEASIFFEVPLQRRYARGRIRSADAVLRQIATRTRFARDQIRGDVLSAFAAMEAAHLSLSYYRSAEVVARQLAEAERRRLEIQASSPLLFAVVRQQQVLDAQVLRVLAEGKYFQSLAEYRASLGLDAVTSEIVRNAPGP